MHTMNVVPADLEAAVDAITMSALSRSVGHSSLLLAAVWGMKKRLRRLADTLAKDSVRHPERYAMKYLLRDVERGLLGALVRDQATAPSGARELLSRYVDQFGEGRVAHLIAAIADLRDDLDDDDVKTRHRLLLLTVDFAEVVMEERLVAASDMSPAALVAIAANLAPALLCDDAPSSWIDYENLAVSAYDAQATQTRKKQNWPRFTQDDVARFRAWISEAKEEVTELARVMGRVAPEYMSEDKHALEAVQSRPMEPSAPGRLAVGQPWTADQSEAKGSVDAYEAFIARIDSCVTGDAYGGTHDLDEVSRVIEAIDRAFGLHGGTSYALRVLYAARELMIRLCFAIEDARRKVERCSRMWGCDDSGGAIDRKYHERVRKL